MAKKYNTENLIKNEELTPSERRESARRAGKASGKARAEKKRLGDLLKILLEQETENGKTNAEEITAQLVRQAKKGNIKAFEVVRDTIGEKPAEEINLNNIEIEITPDHEA